MAEPAADPAAPWPQATGGWSGWHGAYGPLWVLAGTPGSGAGAAEAARLRWLTAHLPCPAVVVAEGDWLVVRAPAGEPATRPEAQPQPGDVPRLIGAALRRLHDLPAAACPFERPWEAVLDEIEQAVADGRIDPAALPEPYGRYAPAELARLARQSRPAARPDDQVVGHGRAVAGNLFFERGELSAVAGVGRLGRADRHADLATAWRSLGTLFGPDALHGLVEGYGRDPDLLRLDHHILLDVLLEAITPEPAPAPSAPAPVAR